MPMHSKILPILVRSVGNCPIIWAFVFESISRQVTHGHMIARTAVRPLIIQYLIYSDPDVRIIPACNKRLCSALIINHVIRCLSCRIMGWRSLNERWARVIHPPTRRIPRLSINKWYGVSLTGGFPFFKSLISTKEDSVWLRQVQTGSTVCSSSELNDAVRLSCFDRALWIKCSIHAVTLFRWLKEDTSLNHSDFLTVTEDHSDSPPCSSAGTGMDITSGFVGQHDCGSWSHWGPWHHNSWFFNSLAYMPLDAQSDGFLAPRMWFQGGNNSKISVTRLPTKILRWRGLPCNQLSMIMLPVQANTLSLEILSMFAQWCNSLASISAPHNSNRGMAWRLMGATLVLAATSAMCISPFSRLLLRCIPQLRKWTLTSRRTLAAEQTVVF